jgi:hypothetical protein
MAHARAHLRWGRKWRALAILVGLGVYAGVLNYRQNNVVSARPIPPGYTYRRPQGDYGELPWSALKRGQWPKNGKPVVAAGVRELDGKPAMVKGFLLPLHNANEASEFFISTRAAGCPFCNPVGVGDVVMLQTKGGLLLPVVNLPVMAYGTLHVATGAATDQALYAMTDTVIVVGQ